MIFIDLIKNAGSASMYERWCIIVQNLWVIFP